MISNGLTQSALALPEGERLELARQLIESVHVEDEVAKRIGEGVRRIEDIANGRVTGLTAEQFQAALQ